MKNLTKQENYMQINIVEDFLNRRDWQFTQLNDKNVLLFGISGKNGTFQCIADLVENENLFVFFSVCGVNVPSEKKSDMTDLLNAINRGLFFGNFQMDRANGEVRYRTSVLYQNLNINESFIEELIMRNIVTMDRCLPSIMNLIYGNISVDEATQQVLEA